MLLSELEFNFVTMFMSSFGIKFIDASENKLGLGWCDSVD